MKTKESRGGGEEKDGIFGKWCYMQAYKYGQHIFFPYLGQYTLSMGRWHRSKEKVAGIYPYGGYLTNKKWHLNEVK